jgi:hypothetical protein
MAVWYTPRPSQSVTQTSTYAAWYETLPNGHSNGPADCKCWPVDLMSLEEQLKPPVEIHGEAVAGRAAAVRRDLLRLNSSLKEMSFDLAELLAEVKAGSLFGTWGFPTFEDYVEEELDMKVRKAQYLVKIVQVCRQVGIERLDYEPRGLSALREITRLDPEKSYYNPETKQGEPLRDHIKRLVLDRTMKLSEVIAEVKRLLGEVGDDEETWVNWKVKRSVKENVILPAQELARRVLGSAGRDEQGNAKEYSDAVVEEKIHQEFLNDPANYAEEPDESKAQVEEPSSEETAGEPPASRFTI